MDIKEEIDQIKTKMKINTLNVWEFEGENLNQSTQNQYLGSHPIFDLKDNSSL